jgi:hypothetical protein
MVPHQRWEEWIPGLRLSAHPGMTKDGLLRSMTEEAHNYRIGGAYWMPPAFHSWLSPRGIFSLESEPILRS